MAIKCGARVRVFTGSQLVGCGVSKFIFHALANIAIVLRIAYGGTCPDTCGGCAFHTCPKCQCAFGGRTSHATCQYKRRDLLTRHQANLGNFWAVLLNVLIGDVTGFGFIACALDIVGYLLTLAVAVCFPRIGNILSDWTNRTYSTYWYWFNGGASSYLRYLRLSCYFIRRWARFIRIRQFLYHILLALLVDALSLAKFKTIAVWPVIDLLWPSAIGLTDSGIIRLGCFELGHDLAFPDIFARFADFA